MPQEHAEHNDAPEPGYHEAQHKTAPQAAGACKQAACKCSRRSAVVPASGLQEGWGGAALRGPVTLTREPQ